MTHRTAQRRFTAALLGVLLPATAAFAQAEPQDITLEAIFNKKEYVGVEESWGRWSPDDRYYAFGWHGLKEKNFDVWVYDTAVNKLMRLTSPEVMRPFDPEAAAEDKYQGVMEFSWANRANQLIIGYNGDIYVFKAIGSPPVRLTRTRDYESMPSFTADDRGFVFSRNGGVFRMRFDSAYAEEMVPALPEGERLGNYVLSPDQMMILFETHNDGPGKPHGFNYMDFQGRFPEVKKLERRLSGDPYEGTGGLYVQELKPGSTPWKIADSTAGKIRQQSNASMLPDRPWSPDSRTVVFSTWKSDTERTAFRTADVRTKTITDVYEVAGPKNRGYPYPPTPYFVLNGTKLAYYDSSHSAFGRLMLLDPKTRIAQPLTPGDISAVDVDFSPDGRSLHVMAGKESFYQKDLYRIDIRSGQWTRLTKRFGRYEVSSGHRGKKFAATFWSWNDLPELYIIDEHGERQITHSHDTEKFRSLMKLKPEPFSYKNRNGQTLYGYLYVPPGFKPTDKRPLLLYAYGGPNVPARSFVRFEFNMYMAYKHGYLAAVIDPRGMLDYGNESHDSNWEAPGKAQSEDLIDGIQALIARGGVDPDKVAFWGGSYSGYLAQYCMYLHPEVFKIGISLAGVSEWQNWEGLYNEKSIGYTADPLGQELDRFSLTKIASKLQGPLLLMHGMRDTTVLFQDTVHVYQELLKAGKGPLVELAIDPTGDHHFNGVLDYPKMYAIMEGFLLRRMPGAQTGAKQ